MTNSRVNDSFAMLIAVQKNEAQDILLQCLDQTWKNDGNVKHLTQKVLPKVINFEEAVNEVMQKTAYVD